MANHRADEQKMLKVCEIIATSHKGVHTACKEINLGLTTFYNWLEANSENRERYARARESQADLLVEEMISLSDDKSGDLLHTDIGEQGNNANVTRSRLQVDTRKWIAAKLRPKKYGDKVEVENSGEVKVITANFGSPIIPSAPQPTEDTQLD
jgi:hypothetical protein